MTNKTIIQLSIAGLALLVSCKSEKKEKVENTKPTVQVQKIGELKIAYYNQDSMKANFLYYKEQDAIVTKKQLAFQATIDTKRKAMESYYNNFMKRVQNNELSQLESEGYQRNLQNQEAEIMQFQETEGAKIEKETLEKLEAIGNKIDKFSKAYCEENGIDILLIYAKGGQFNYINPSMDVTKEFTAFLNQNQEAIQKDLRKK